jgi:hypothetical protein
LGERSLVWLVVEGVDGGAEMTLNGQAVGEIAGGQGPARFDITTELLAHNLLEIAVTTERGRGGGLGLGLVRLEIE